ncbi:MAG TPA: response regulator transcription factor [Pilimelia sp.]|nr:response regulator transcription factor [Pilimelia sp.]
MVRVVVLEDRPLAAGGLATLLSREEGITVVGTLDFEVNVVWRVAALGRVVVVISTEYMVSQLLPLTAELQARNPQCSILVLSDPSKPGMLPPRRRTSGLSFMLKDEAGPVLAKAIRRVSQGEQVIDPRLVLASIGTKKEISTRELEVMGLAAEGEPVAEIARRLYLSFGTVRNHISSVIMKTGARNRIDAIRIVRKGGWLR